MADKSQQTEQPTQRRLEKARNEGQFPAAREFVGAVQFLVFLGFLASGSAGWFQSFRRSVVWLLESACRRELSVADVTRVAWELFWKHVLPLAAGGMALVVVTLAFRLATTKFGISFKKLAPDAARFSPLSHFREIPRQNLPNLVQAAILIPLFLWAVYAIARDNLEAFLRLPLQSVEAGFRLTGASLEQLCWKAAGVFLVFGSVDLFRQLRRYQQDLQMSKQEVREEAKESEGNPQIKAKIRRLQRERMRRQMMKDVEQATAVIVNPTHYAVAIRYEIESMVAPRVLAKGKNYLALRIRQRAVAHQVPIIENPPLAQALHKAVDVGQEIPPHLYRAVAEILAYIFKLMNGRLPG